MPPVPLRATPARFERAWRRKRVGDFAHVMGRALLHFFSSTVLLLLLIITPPALHALGVPIPMWLLGASVLLLVVLQVVNLYARGSARWDVERRIGVIHGSLAGNIDNLALGILASSARRLRERDAQAICVGLLHRVRQYAELILDGAKEARVRATLAVPIVDNGGFVSHMRVWCYDEPYDDRRWSLIPMGLPGSPTAFTTGRVEVIRDLQTLNGIGDLGQRRFRSVLSIPVTAGGPAGEKLAVVNLDASPPDYFTPENTDRLLPIVMPTLACVALVLLALEDEAEYQFGPVSPARARD